MGVESHRRLRVGSGPHCKNLVNLLEKCRYVAYAGIHEDLFEENWPEFSDQMDELIDEYGGRFVGEYEAMGEDGNSVWFDYVLRDASVDALEEFGELLTRMGFKDVSVEDFGDM